MAGMVDMKLSAEDQRKYETAMCGPGSIDAPDYPWGLRLHLEGPQMKALELGMLKPGTKVAIMGVAEVKSVSLDDSGDGERRSMSLQIVELGVTPKADEKPTSDLLYNGE